MSKFDENIVRSRVKIIRQTSTFIIPCSIFVIH